MSHIVTIKTKSGMPIRPGCLSPAFFGRTSPGQDKLFSGEVEGLAVQLPDWIYPVVCNLPAGQLHYDNFNGRWVTRVA